MKQVCNMHTITGAKESYRRCDSSWGRGRVETRRDEAEKTIKNPTRGLKTYWARIWTLVGVMGRGVRGMRRWGRWGLRLVSCACSPAERNMYFMDRRRSRRGFCTCHLAPGSAATAT